MAISDEHLRHIEHEIESINRNTKQSFFSSIVDALLRGAAFTIGSIAILAFGGYLLTVLGIVPGLGQISQDLNRAIQTQRLR